MQNHNESQSFNWFDELPVGHAPPIVIKRDSIPSHANVVVPTPQAPERRVPIWVLVFSALAGASTFVLGATLLSLI
jgi:hypothetical protein